MVELLLSKGADVNSLSCGGTPLHVAAMENHGAVMKILLDYNADVRFMTFTIAHFLFSRADTVTHVINYTKLFSSLFMKEWLVTFCQKLLTAMNIIMVIWFV